MKKEILVNSAEYETRVAILEDGNLVELQVERPETAHFILRVTDKGSPPLSRYRRVIVNVSPD